MSHYVSSETGFVIVPINKIIIDNSIISAVKKYGGRVPRGIRVTNEFSSPLNRMEPIISSNDKILVPSVFDAIRNLYPLEPIILKAYRNTGYYTIIEGRHRIAASIILNLEYIPANIYE